MDKNTLQKLKDAIAKSNSIGIAVGQNPTVDQMGAALSLYLLLQGANKQASVASASDPIVELSSLVGIDRVQKQFGGDAGDLVVSFPYKEGEIEKVSYTLENNFLNIIVKASEQGLNFQQNDVRFIRGGGGNVDLLITIGVPNLADINSVIDQQKLQGVQIINIDNSPNNQGYGDVVIVTPQASSLSELVADVALTLGFSIEKDAAQNLMSGIMTATHNFQHPRTSSLAFEVSAFLMKRGARRIAIQNANNFQQTQQPAPQPRPQAQPQAAPQPQQQYNQQPQQQAPQQPAPQPQQQQAANNQANGQAQDDAPPLDWLTPKVYKGSSDV